MTILRTADFGRENAESLRQVGYAILTEVCDEVTRRLKARPSGDDQIADDGIFDPIVESYTISSVLNGEYSKLYRDIANQVWEEVRNFEQTSSTLNKRRLFFFMALCSIYSGDEINATIYWELTSAEEARLAKTNSSIDSIIEQMEKNFVSITRPVQKSINSNGFLEHLRKNSTLNFDFGSVSASLSNVSRLSLLTCGVRYNKIGRWLNSDYEGEMVRRYAEELLSSLCILSETILKLHRPEVTQMTMGGILHNDLQKLSANISKEWKAILANYPTKTDAEFNASLPSLLTAMRNGMHEDTLKAAVIHCAYMCRNKVLHEATVARVYYSNPQLFDDIIGALFMAAKVVRDLKV